MDIFAQIDDAEMKLSVLKGLLEFGRLFMETFGIFAIEFRYLAGLIEAMGDEIHKNRDSLLAKAGFYGAFKNSLLAWERSKFEESGDVSIKQGCSNTMSNEQLRFNCEQQEGRHFAVLKRCVESNCNWGGRGQFGASRSPKRPALKRHGAKLAAPNRPQQTVHRLYIFR
ncbi:hypothetical protein GPALN_003322 [Globodera pallida]|nr:hypothetical protein GPALN_003322 [Globodera pallida]